MRAYRLGFVVEDALGHRAHRAQLERHVEQDASVRPTWMPIPYRADDRWGRIPVVRGNLSLLLSLRAQRQVAEAGRGGVLDALFYHTQVTALFSLRLARRLPVIVSLDATPRNMDDVGVGYGHRPGTSDPLDGPKTRWNRAVFRRSAVLTTWSRWARDSLVRDYQVDGSKIAVIPPGVDLHPPPAERPGPAEGRPDRLLFVGGDFRRKGGHVLLEALRGGLDGRCELDVVTRDDAVRPGGAVRVHRGLETGSPELRRLFERADLFVLPTLGDCMPIAILEAMAAGTAVVASDVGAIHEQVDHGTTGLLVPPGDAGALALAIRSLLDDPPRLRSFAAAGRYRAERLFDGGRNARALIDLVKHCVDDHRDRAAASGTPAGRGRARADAGAADASPEPWDRGA